MWAMLYNACMSKKKTEPLFNSEQLAAFSYYMKNFTDAGKILLQLAGFSISQSVVEKAKYSPHALSVAKMNTLFEKASFMFGSEEKPQASIDAAFHFQKVTNALFAGKDVEVHYDKNGIFYKIEEETFCTSHEFFCAATALFPKK